MSRTLCSDGSLTKINRNAPGLSNVRLGFPTKFLILLAKLEVQFSVSVLN